MPQEPSYPHLTLGVRNLQPMFIGNMSQESTVFDKSPGSLPNINSQSQQHGLDLSETPLMSRHGHGNGQDQSVNPLLPFPCHLCNKRYQTSTGLNLHIQAHKGKSFVCCYCDARFPYKCSLKRHLAKVHKAAQCPNCQLTFSLSEFNHHLLHCR